ncbi:glutamate racemase [Loigolactobacillus backii]|uniref:Glutamate racemase n=1 Tax=Loigolactobacillus backii TaxID=375175 RepID=A0A192H2X5_9LACO|nr:glutamate racemase [Loigolactobacillus backii]ANK59211.1 glutamate racemase [Loigolactobacillus backii]ANK62623.1 glutamate racemase [Loigolactobacillus backii]ANK64201.1 glutamate racemase [Loigolactobacillus backii]ANK67404.1 glutamate racemase [Loigolactobacillus backii]ANK70369.1 glutamate racemase [Loigolactobacillus backii]
MSNEQAIGFMDSGVGGLTVVREAMRQLPNERVVYIGDTARNPYGPRPQEQVKQFTWDMTNFLLAQNVKMIVIACNTATAAALEEIKDKLKIPVIGVILPGSRAAIKATKNQRIGVIGTQGTIKSAAYAKAIHQKAAHVTVSSLACPEFVSLVESNEYRSAVAKKVVADDLSYFADKNIDTLVMGCTHYPLLRPLIQNFVGDQVTLIDSGAETVTQVSMLLDYFEIANENNQVAPQHAFYTTGNPKMFNEIAGDWLQLGDLDTQHVDF